MSIPVSPEFTPSTVSGGYLLNGPGHCISSNIPPVSEITHNGGQHWVTMKLGSVPRLTREAGVARIENWFLGCDGPLDSLWDSFGYGVRLDILEQTLNDIVRDEYRTLVPDDRQLHISQARRLLAEKQVRGWFETVQWGVSMCDFRRYVVDEVNGLDHPVDADSPGYETTLSLFEYVERRTRDSVGKALALRALYAHPSVPAVSAKLKEKGTILVWTATTLYVPKALLGD